MPSEIATLNDVIASFDRHGDRPAVGAMQTEGLEEWSFARLADTSRRLAAGLHKAGLEPGSRAALVAPNRPEWMVSCFALIHAGAVPVLIDAQIPPEKLARILHDSDASWVLSTSDLCQQLEPSQGDSPREIVLLDDSADEPRSWRRFLADEPAEPHPAQIDDMAVLFYTSGTSGAAKGVPLRHRNLASNVQSLIQLNLLQADDRVLLPLPLHHVYAFTVGMLVPLATGIPVLLPESLGGPQIVRTLREARATALLGVPRLYSALLPAIEGRIAERGRIAAGAFRMALALSTCLRYRTGLRIGHRLFAKLHEQFAPALEIVTSGGSPLDPAMARKLEGLGWRFANGYGLTETSPVVAFNEPGRARIGTVGRPVAGVDVRIAEPREGQAHGEIQVKGPNVFSGYWNRPEETEAAFTSDGYFRTGDLGERDRDGYLRVLGRASSLIVMPGGENVWPEDVEQALAGSDRIAEAGVLLHEEKLVALVVPESGPFRGAGREEVASELRADVARISRQLPSHHRVAHVQVTRQPLDRTRLGKLRRHLLEQRYEAIQRHGDAAEPQAGPMPIEDMPEEVRKWFGSPAVGRTWDWLAARFSDVRLGPETHLEADLGIDSMEWLHLGLEIQQQTGQALPEEVVRRIETVGDLLREVAEAQQREPAEGQDVVHRLREPDKLLDDQQRTWLRPRGGGLRAVGGLCRVLARLLLRGGCRLQVSGQEHVSGTQPMIILPNHPSYLDAPTVLAALPGERLSQTTWGGAASVMFRSRSMRLLSRAMRVIPIDPQRGSAASLALAATALERGDTVVWFPEGRVSRTGRLQPFLPGIGLLLEAQPVPVVPVWIAGSREALPPDAWRPRLRQVSVRFGKPIALNDIPREGDDEVERAQQMAEFLRERVAELERT